MKASGTNAINMVKDNSQLQAGAAALKSKASQLTDNVSSKCLVQARAKVRCS